LPAGEDAELYVMKPTARRSWIVGAENVQWLPAIQRRDRSRLESRAREVYFPAGKPRDFASSAVIESERHPAGWRSEQGVASFRDAAALRQGRPKSAGDCRIIYDSPQRVVLSAELSRPGLLVLSDLYTEDWQASAMSEGQPATPLPVLRTNRVLRGVWLPAGRWRVGFVYRPRLFVVGAAVSGVAWCLLLAAWLFMIWRHARWTARRSRAT
jgi:hypothetical protein